MVLQRLLQDRSWVPFGESALAVERSAVTVARLVRNSHLGRVV